jgi:hypothetical protein
MVIGQQSATPGTRPNLFTQWLDEMELSRAQAAVLLGKTERAVGYYETGERPLSLTVLYLMEALSKGFRPRHALRKGAAE